MLAGSCFVCAGTHINKLHDVIKEVRSKVFSLQDVVVKSRIKLVKQEEQTAAERSKVEIKVHLGEERQVRALTSTFELRDMPPALTLVWPASGGGAVD